MRFWHSVSINVIVVVIVVVVVVVVSELKGYPVGHGNQCSIMYPE